MMFLWHPKLYDIIHSSKLRAILGASLNYKVQVKTDRALQENQDMRLLCTLLVMN